MLLRKIIRNTFTQKSFRSSLVVEELLQSSEEEGAENGRTHSLPNSIHLFSKPTAEVFTVEPNLDFYAKLQNLSVFENNLKRRGIIVQDSYLTDLRNRYENWVKLMAENEKLSAQLDVHKTDPDKKKKEEILKEFRKNHELLKPLHQAAFDCLNLPNDLLPETPDSQKILAKLQSVAHNSEEEPIEYTHAKTLHSLGFLKFGYRPATVSLAGRAESLRNSLIKYCSDHMRQDAGSTLVSTPHMVRPAIVEGCLLDKSSSFRDPIYPAVELNPQLKKNLQLVGISLPSFLAMFTRKIFSKSTPFPQKFYAIGAAYSNPKSATPNDLFDLPQYSCANTVLFETQLDRGIMEYGKLKIIVRNLLEFLKIRCSVTQTSASDLSRSEMAQVSFRYGWCGTGPELATVSFYGTFISDRLRICHASNESQDPERNLVHIASASVNIHGLLAAIVEDYGWNSNDLTSCKRIPLDLRE